MTLMNTDLEVKIKEAETQLAGWLDRVDALREAGASRRDIRLAQGAVNTWDERLVELRQKEKNS